MNKENVDPHPGQYHRRKPLQQILEEVQLEFGIDSKKKVLVLIIAHLYAMQIGIIFPN